MLLVQTRLGRSRIHGIGLFADAFIPKNTVVWRFTPSIDIIVDRKELLKLPKVVRAYFLQYAYLNRKMNHYVLHADNARFLNHSPQPNLRSVRVSDQTE